MHLDHSTDVIHTSICLGRGVAPERGEKIDRVRSVIREALCHMQRECERRCCPAVWEMFQGRVLASVLGSAKAPYLEMAIRYKLSSPAQAESLLIAGRRMFARALRMALAGHRPDEARIDREIADLRTALVCD